MNREHPEFIAGVSKVILGLSFFRDRNVAAPIYRSGKRTALTQKRGPERRKMARTYFREARAILGRGVHFPECYEVYRVWREERDRKAAERWKR